MNTAILAFSGTCHPSVIKLIISYIVREKTNNSTIRRMTIFSLACPSRANKEVLLPIYSSLIDKPAEERDVSTSALVMHPNTVHFQKAAASTWFEKDGVIARFIYSTLNCLNKIQRSQL